MSEQQDISFTHETLAMHLGPGGYYMLAESDGKISGLHMGPAGLTSTEHRVNDPFDSLRATTITWRSVHSVGIDSSDPDFVNLGIDSDSHKWVWKMPRAEGNDALELARAIYQTILQGLGSL